MKPLLPYLLITLKTIKFGKLSLNDKQSLRTVFKHIDCCQKYSLLNRDNFTPPTQMQLSLKGKTFSEFFSAFLK